MIIKIRVPNWGLVGLAFCLGWALGLHTPQPAPPTPWTWWMGPIVGYIGGWCITELILYAHNRNPDPFER